MEPLVSVVVVTYNSAKTIVDTLESIRKQTYPNLELVVSDDCSKDNTVEVVKDWMEHHGNMGILVQSERNTGTSGNLNRGILASSGPWIKIIAGDDMLREDAIAKFVDYVNETKCLFCVSDLQPFNDGGGEVSESIKKEYAFYFETLHLTREEKINQLARWYSFAGPAFFFHRDVFNMVGGYDERYPLCDEIPFVYKALEAGINLFPLNEKLVLYRCRTDSVSSSRNSGFQLINKQLFLDTRRIFRKIQLPILLKNGDFRFAIKRARGFSHKTIKYFIAEHPVIYRFVAKRGIGIHDDVS